MTTSAQRTLGRLDSVSLDTKRLVEDLHAHQVELEAQNRELRAAQAELAEEQARYADLYDFAPVGYVTVGRDGRVRQANLTCARLLDVPRSSLVGAYLRRFVAAASMSDWQTFFGHVWASGQSQAVTVTFCRPSGTQFRCEVRSGATPGSESRMILRDVTEAEELLAKAQQADRLITVGTMCMGVAHEINNPLTYVLLNAQIVARQLADPARPLDRATIAAQLEEICAGAERVGDIVRSLQAFARPTADDPPRPADAVELIESSILLVKNQIESRAQLVRDYQPVPEVLAQPARLGQVFLNLLINAAQAIEPDRSSENEIRVSVHADAGGGVVVEVADTGPGVAPEIAPRLFEPFATTKEPGKGMGLGLYVCHQTVAAHGGELALLPSQTGARFRVRLPAAPASGPYPRARSRDLTPVGTAPAAPFRILVVDDDPSVLRSCRDALEGYAVTCLTSGSAAIARLERAGDFDMILCDVMMRDGTGIDVHNCVSRHRPSLVSRFIFMTGGAFSAEAQEMQSLSTCRFLFKPFQLGELRRLAAEASRRR